MSYTHALPTLRNLYIISSLVIIYFSEEIRISATHTRQGREHNRQPEEQRSVLRHQFDSYLWAVSQQRGRWGMPAGWTGLVTGTVWQPSELGIRPWRRKHYFSPKFWYVPIRLWPVPIAARSKAVGLLPLACWDRGFESYRGHGCFVCCECYMLSGRGLCDELITRPEESYRLWCVVVCDLETSKMRRPWPTLGSSAKENKNKNTELRCTVNRTSDWQLSSSFTSLTWTRSTQLCMDFCKSF